MTSSQKIIYRFFQQTVWMLILYGVAALVAGVKFLAPVDGLLTVLPYHQAGSLTNVLLRMTVLTGLIGGGLYVANQRRLNRLTLRIVGIIWPLLLGLTVAAGLFGLLGSRNYLELPLLLDGVQVIGLLLVLLTVLPARHSPQVQLWALGVVFVLLGTMIALVPSTDFLQDRQLRAIALGLQFYTAFPLMALALGYWLMHRFSDLTMAWLEHDIYIAAGLVLLAGVCLTLASTQTMPEWMNIVGGTVVVIVPISYLLVVARCYTAFTRRNATYTLAAHWFTLSLLLFFLTFGLLAAVQFAPAIRIYAIGTRLTDLQLGFTLLAAVAMVLGVINQAAAELRGYNWRITGLTPFWLVSAGILGGGLALAAAGVVQLYLERMLSIGYLDTQTLLVPLYVGWVLGLLVFVFGVLLYALGFRANRPVQG